jgi:hypothetical protein
VVLLCAEERQRALLRNGDAAHRSEHRQAAGFAEKRRPGPRYHQGHAMIRVIVTIGLLVAAVLYLYWLGAFDLPISIARWWIGGHGRR